MCAYLLLLRGWIPDYYADCRHVTRPQESLCVPPILQQLVELFHVQVAVPILGRQTSDTNATLHFAVCG